MIDRFLVLGRKTVVYMHRAVSSIILATLIIGVVGFLIKWCQLLIHPGFVLLEFRNIIEDIFSLVLVYEMLDLSRTLAPSRLLDLLLAALARKILLSTNDNHLMVEVISFCLLILMRFLWVMIVKPNKTPAG